MAHEIFGRGVGMPGLLFGAPVRQISGVADTDLKADLLNAITSLERQIDAVGDTPTRHYLSELLAEMRFTLHGVPRLRCEKEV